MVICHFSSSAHRNVNVQELDLLRDYSVGDVLEIEVFRPLGAGGCVEAEPAAEKEPDEGVDEVEAAPGGPSQVEETTHSSN